MRDLGSMEGWSKKANLAYQTYGSLYLDCVDDNIKHFTWRDIDLRPLRDLEDRIDNPSNEQIISAYINACLGIITYAGPYMTLEQIYSNYPLLKEYAPQVEIARKKNQIAI